MPGEPLSWTTIAGLRALSLKAWNSGALLRELLENGRLSPPSDAETPDGDGAAQ